MEKCKYYPTNEEDGCICDCGSDVSGYECTKLDELSCQWAKFKTYKIKPLEFNQQGGERLEPSNLEIADKLNEVIKYIMKENK
jgi:hypothetical protein